MRRESSGWYFQTYYVLLIQDLSKKRRASYIYRTATTVCLCCLPALEDWTGADRKRLALQGAKVIPSFKKASINKHLSKEIAAKLIFIHLPALTLITLLLWNH
jgi:hypothetical protein